MRKYVIDTNLYIRAVRDREENEALAGFFELFTPAIHLHSVVALELLAGATSVELQRRTHESFLRPLLRRGRVITPTAGAWARAGSAIAQLVREKRLSPGDGVTKSLVNDCLIAASARDDGFVLVTENLKDFALVKHILPIDVVAPWP